MQPLRHHFARGQHVVWKVRNKALRPERPSALRRRLDRALLSLLTFGVVSAVVLNAFLTRRRMSHDNGIVGLGRIKLTKDPRFPAHEFFSTGNEFECTIRHGAASYQDDAMFVVRSASLRFAALGEVSPCDMLMNTGESVAFNSAWAFAQFMWVTLRGRSEKVSRRMFNKYPRLWVGLQGLNRRNPSSYAQLHYFTKTPLEYVARDGKRRYVKFRLLPAGGGPETGIPDRLDKETPWNQEVMPDEKRGPNYLKQEYAEHVAKEGVAFRLLLQLHEWSDGDTRDVFDAARVWDEETHPWMELGTVEIDKTISYDDSIGALFSLAKLPSTLKLIEPLSPTDPPSMDHLRLAGYWGRRARLAGTRVLGVPAPPPDRRAIPKQAPPPRGSAVAPTLPQRDSAERQRARDRDVEHAREQYRWQHSPGLPPFARELPEGKGFSKRQARGMMWDLEKTAVDLGLYEIAQRSEPHGTLEEFDPYYLLEKKPEVAWRFHRDDEFGRQRVAGVNPVLLERCTEIPEHFPVTDEVVRGVLAEGETLDSAAAEGRLYSLDYRILEGLSTHPGRYLTAPHCLLWLNPQQQLVPVAIQLGQTPAAGPIFTPSDDPWLWLLAKTFVQSADASYHECASHLLRTHLLVETIAVATARQLDRCHPVAALLTPHFETTFAINHSARTSMLAPGGALDKVMAGGADGSLDLIGRAWAEYRFDRFDLRTDLAARGVGDPELLPHYPYRDDALRLWDEIAGFVGDVLGYYYSDDDDEVRKDWEIQAWARELVDEQGGQIQGLPGEGAINTLSQLAQIVTQVIFTATSEHSSVNNGQWDMFGYIPNVPGALFAPPPTTRDPITQRQFVEALPHRSAAAMQLAMVHLLSMPTDNPLGSYKLTDFCGGDPFVSKRALQFIDGLEQISLAIEVRNLALTVPYTYLDPKQIAQSIAI